MTEQDASDGAGDGESPLSFARQVADAMYAKDVAAQNMGIKLSKISPGYAVMTMLVSDKMLNGHAICHGGYIFALADTAFAFACNTANITTVTLANNITFLAPAKEGDMLTAVAEVQNQAGRTGLCDVIISNQEGTKIAMVRGNSYRLKSKIVEGMPSVDL
ncbi:hydroxyphenylacetyl-CoA thioesterase PaaI [Emcibacter sp.]|uniref:hydroxyphenylacetyl-CoA thioesterase PaaI n=1 Tax=Emcibacter sp. TaxID=1979954 RepID=UPI002AA65249|nr:hydroxyphenylacetyl-CoA thioesterase PaaI [Emcibacter sp.]